ncbi:hypothetical protein YC2023_065589 [Brassica napus]
MIRQSLRFLNQILEKYIPKFVRRYLNYNNLKLKIYFFCCRVPNAVFERGANLHSDYIVGIFYGNAPSYGKIWGVLNFLWGKDRRVTIHKLTANAYLFHIPSTSLRQKVLQHELWRVGDSPFFVTEWKASFALDPPSLQKAPVWVKLANVPFDLLTDEGLAIISEPLGVIVDAKPFTSVSEAEIKVVVDLLQPLMKTVEVEREDGGIQVITVTYPWLPPLCPVCNELGHKSQLCPVAKKASVEKGKAPMDSEKSFSKPKKQAGASYIPKKKAGTLIISDGEVALESVLNVPVDESQARNSDLPSSSHSYVEVCKSNIGTINSPTCQVPTVNHLLEAKLGSDKALVPAQISKSTEIGNQAIQKKSAEYIPFTTVSKAARQRDIIPIEKSRVLVTSANPFAALASDVVSNPDQSSSDDASEDQECLVVTNFIRSNDFNLASPSSSSGSKQQKNKKRKLAKRSPGSGGHPHSHGGTHQN